MNSCSCWFKTIIAPSPVSVSLTQTLSRSALPQHLPPEAQQMAAETRGDLFDTGYQLADERGARLRGSDAFYSFHSVSRQSPELFPSVIPARRHLLLDSDFPVHMLGSRLVPFCDLNTPTGLNHVTLP